MPATGRYYSTSKISQVQDFGAFPPTVNFTFIYHNRGPKFSDARKLCCNLHKIQTKRSNLRVFHKKDANGIANSEDPDQTAP